MMTISAPIRDHRYSRPTYSQPPTGAATGIFDGAMLGAVLATARSHSGLSQTEAAQRAGLHKSVVSRIESGTIACPRFDIVAKLAFVYGLSLDALAAHVGLPRTSCSFVPPLDLEISDARLRGALLTLAQATDSTWVDRVIDAISATVGTQPG